MKLPISVVIIASVAVGCSGGSGGGYVPTPAPKIEPVTIQTGQESNLFPLATGNTWTYVATTVARVGNQTQQGTKDAIFKVIKSEDVAGGKRATLELSIDDKVVDRQVWLVNSKGIYQVSVSGQRPRTFSTPIPAITFPVEAGKKFSWSGSDGKAKMSYENEVVGIGEVDTDMKRMSAVSVDAKGTSVLNNVTEKTERTMWMVPGVGIVRIRESTGSATASSELLLSLKSYTVK